MHIPVNPALLFDRAILPALISAWNRTEEWGEWKLVWTKDSNMAMEWSRGKSATT
jgi:hypothetical protein